MGIVKDFITHAAVEVTRYSSAGAMQDDGTVSKGTGTLINIDMSIQPLTGKERLLLPELIRTSEAIKIFTEVQMFPADDVAKTAGDTFLYNGRTFEVSIIEDWFKGAYSEELKHYKIFATMVDNKGSERHV